MFKKGDILVFIGHFGNLKQGAKGICQGYSREGNLINKYVQVKWIRNSLSGKQWDGGYYPEDFKLFKSCKLDLSHVKPYPIVAFLEGKT